MVMSLSRLRLLSVTVCLVLSAIAHTVQTTVQPTEVKRIRETIAKGRSGKTVGARTDSAQHLAFLTKEISAKASPDRFVTDIASLMDSSEDSGRLWLAAALGDL